MEAGFKFEFRDNSSAVIKASEEGSYEALKSTGAYISKAASNSIKKKSPKRDPKTGRPLRPGSPEGTPPFSYTGHFRRVFRFYVERKEQTVRIGPINKFQNTIWDLHEKGGSRQDKRRKAIKRRTYAMNDFGPIRSNDSGGKVRSIKLTTASQVRRANEKAEEVNALRESQELKTRKFPARPFMGPALARSKDKVAKFWEGSVK